MEIIHDIDAATKGHAPVNHAELAVQTAPAHGKKHPQPTQRREAVPAHASRVKARRPWQRQRRSANAIDHQIDLHAAQRRAL